MLSILPLESITLPRLQVAIRLKDIYVVFAEMTELHILQQETRESGKMTVLVILPISASPEKLLLIAIEERRTIITTAKRSSTIRTARTCDVNLRCIKLRSVSAFKIIVVDDIESMPPRNRLLIKEKPIIFPAKKPVVIIPDMITSAVIAAEPPTFSNFLKLNSKPREKSRNIIPNSAQKSIFASLTTVGKKPQ